MNVLTAFDSLDSDKRKKIIKWLLAFPLIVFHCSRFVLIPTDRSTCWTALITCGHSEAAVPAHHRTLRSTYVITASCACCFWRWKLLATFVYLANKSQVASYRVPREDYLQWILFGPRRHFASLALDYQERTTRQSGYERSLTWSGTKRLMHASAS